MLAFWLTAALWMSSLRAVLDLPPSPPVQPAAGLNGITVNPPHPPAPADLLTLSDEELFRRVEEDAASLGSLSIGAAGGGILVNPVALPSDPGWHLIDPNGAFATSPVQSLQQV